LIIVDTVSDVVTSVQFTTVPFRSSLTGLIDNVDVTGKAFSAELLEWRNVVEPIVCSNTCRWFGPEFWRLCVCLIGPVSFSGIREKLHSRNLPVVLHVRIRVSPLHTDAILGGEITAPPVTGYFLRHLTQSWHAYIIILTNCYVPSQYNIQKEVRINRNIRYFMIYPKCEYDIINARHAVSCALPNHRLHVHTDCACACVYLRWEGPGDRG
jgi:hypothetical protein